MVASGLDDVYGSAGVVSLALTREVDAPGPSQFHHGLPGKAA